MIKHFAFLSVIIFILTGCATGPQKAGEVILIVKLKTSLNEDVLLKKAREREPEFAANPAIIQKYYVKLKEPGHYAGVYIWESAEALKKFKQSKLAKSIPGAYKVVGKPDVEVGKILFQLRE